MKAEWKLGGEKDQEGAKKEGTIGIRTNRKMKLCLYVDESKLKEETGKKREKDHQVEKNCHWLTAYQRTVIHLGHNLQSYDHEKCRKGNSMGTKIENDGSV